MFFIFGNIKSQIKEYKKEILESQTISKKYRDLEEKMFQYKIISLPEETIKEEINAEIISEEDSQKEINPKETLEEKINENEIKEEENIK